MSGANAKLNAAQSVVFDLDGTLARTQDLPPGRRQPAQLLNIDPFSDGKGQSQWAFWDVPKLVSYLVASGRPVVVMTRSPRPYAATALGLIGLPGLNLFASTDGKRQQLLRRMNEARPTLFIGDADEDREIAEAAGVEFLHVDQVRGRVRDLDDDWQDDVLPKGVAPGDVARLVPLLALSPRCRRVVLEALAVSFGADHRFCLVHPAREHGRAWKPLGFTRPMFTQVETATMASSVNEILRRLFPLRRREGVGTDVRYVVPFSSALNGRDPLGREMVRIKDYDGASRRSGPDVEFQSLRFIARVLGAHLADIAPSSVDVVPASPFKPEQPARASLWLGAWAAAHAKLRLSPPVTPEEWAQRDSGALAGAVRRGRNGPWLVDDQITTGRTVRAWSALRRQTPGGVLTFSSSRVPETVQPQRRPSGCMWPDEGDCPVHDTEVVYRPVGLKFVEESTLERTSTVRRRTTQTSGSGFLVGQHVRILVGWRVGTIVAIDGDTAKVRYVGGKNQRHEMVERERPVEDLSIPATLPDAPEAWQKVTLRDYGGCVREAEVIETEGALFFRASYTLKSGQVRTHWFDLLALKSGDD